MVYSNKFVICILVNGKVQKEKKNGVVNLPFGTEYTIRLRNKNDRRCCADIYIDGECVSGGGYVVDANDYMDIKRHNDRDRAFKFVSLDSEDAVDYGKNGDNDDGEKGTIEVRFRMEKEDRVKYVPLPYIVEPVERIRPIVPYPTEPWRPVRPYRYHTGYNVTCDNNSSSGDPNEFSMKTTNSVQSQSQQSAYFSSCDASQTLDLNETKSSYRAPEGVPVEDGCTVEGKRTGQSFRTVHFVAEATETVLRIFLQGFEDKEALASTKPKKKKKRRRKSEVQKLKEEISRLTERLEDLEDED